METVYNVYRKGLGDGAEDWVNGDYRALLLTGSVTIDPDHATVAAVIAANTEASDASYARQALGSKTNTQDDTNDRANLDAATIDFGSLTNETPTAMLIFRQVTNDADSIPVSIHDTNFGTAANGAGYTVTLPNDLIRIS
jgi:hypothetical protein